MKPFTSRIHYSTVILGELKEGSVLMKTEQAATERSQKLQNDRELLEIKAVMVEPKHSLMCARILRAKDIF